MNEKTKNILQIAGIWYALYFIIACIFMLTLSDGEISSLKELLMVILGCFIFPITLSIFVIIAFFPAIIVLYFLFKKYTNKTIRMWLTAFIIPFTNMIYFFIEHFLIEKGIPGFWIISMYIGFCTLFFVIPLTIVVALCIPVKLLEIKWEVVKGSILMFVIGWVLIFVSFILIDGIEWIIDNYTVKQYEPVIEKIEQYKNQNGIYPETVEDTVNKLQYFIYETENDNNDFILTVYDKDNEMYHYCSNKETKVCKTGWHDYRIHTKVNEWTKNIVDYDD